MLKPNLLLSLERALQLNTAALAVMGALFLKLGQEGTLVPLLLAACAVAAVCLTDVLDRFRLNRLLGNLIAIAAVIWSLRNFFHMAPTGQLLAIAHMLVYLQIVLLFQEKNARVYWQLFVLSLLQVVVAAALDMGPQFALLLGAYILLAVSSLLLLCVYRDLREEPPWRPFRLRASPERMPQPGHVWQSLLAPPTIASSSLATQTAGFSEGMTIRLAAWQIAAMAGATFTFTAVFFYATPRLNDASWLGPRNNAAGATGFAPEVRLAEAGQILLSQRVVMRVTLTRMIDRQPVPLTSEPYFHGAALTTYVADEQGSRWTITQSPWPLARMPEGTSLVRQDVVLETQRGPQLLAIWPVLRVRETPSELGERSFYGLALSGQDGSSLARQYRYVYATPAIKSGRQLAAIPHQKRAPFSKKARAKSDPRTDAELFEAELSELRVFDQERFPRLAETAARVIKEQNVEHTGPLEKAFALERHFRLPGAYNYSLNLDLPRNRQLDPIEDFVANHRTGYCEYFASALALMLRSQGIPSRIVTGYRGGQFNDLGRYFVVQQRHAHAWVEAWMPPGEVPDYEVAGSPSSGGCWYRLDPTPPARTLVTSDDESGIGHRLAQAFDYVDLLWRDYVLSLNAARQQDTFFDPLTTHATSLPAWSEGRSFQRWLRRMTRRFGFEVPFAREQPPRRVFESTVAIIVAGGLVLLIVGVQVTLFARRHLRRWLGSAEAGGGASSVAPAFYWRLERLLSRAGLRRQRGQTAQELAITAARHLAAGPSQAAAGLPPEIVAAYYRVRFGGARLDKVETDAIEHSLAALNAALHRKHHT